MYRDFKYFRQVSDWGWDGYGGEPVAMVDSSPAIELYELQGCPYCAKVRRALGDLGLTYESRDVPRSRRDRSAVYEASGQYGVPVLVDRANGVEGMAESDDIVAYLYRKYGDGTQPPPSGFVGRLLARLF